MRILAESYSVKTDELLEALEWSDSKIDFSAYHFKTIKYHLIDLLYYSPYIVCYVKKNDRRILTLTAKIFNDKVEIVVINNFTGRIYRKPLFELNRWVLPQFKIDSYRSVTNEN